MGQGARRQGLIPFVKLQAVGRFGKSMARAEPFGATIAFHKPEMLVMVDRAMALQLGVADFPAPQPGSCATDPHAPYEAHLTVGRNCSVGCSACYIDAGQGRRGPVDISKWEAILERLAQMGVFHVAIGGGEDDELEDLIHLASKARQLGLTPNLTTAAWNVTPAVAKRLGVFHRVHVSMDGLGDTYRQMRGHDGFARAHTGLEILKAYHPHVGVNCVVGRRNYEELEELFSLLHGLKISEVELLRFKPTGRGRALFDSMDLSHDQYDHLVKKVLKLAFRYRVRVRLDCSFTPMVCAGGYDPSVLAKLGVAGCVAGSWLVSIDPEGGLSGCSFDSEPVGSWTDLGKPGLFAKFSNWTNDPPMPCGDCAFLDICRGGCHLVARHVTGDFEAPDPSCPIVRRWSESGR